MRLLVDNLLRWTASHETVGWGTSAMVHVASAVVLWTTFSALSVDPELTGNLTDARVDLTASWVEEDPDPQAVEIRLPRPQVVVMPDRAEVATRTYFKTSSDVSKPTPVELAMVDRLTAAARVQSRRDADDPQEAATGSDVPPPHRLEYATPTALAATRPQAVASPQKQQSMGTTDRLLPRLLDSRPPEYPIQAKLAGIEGRVLLRLNVTASGAVGKLEVLVSSGHGILDAAAVRAVRHWRFLPATRTGKPVSRTIRLPVHFLM